MRVIVSKDLKDRYSTFKVVDSLAKVSQFSDVNCVIIHTYSDSNVQIGIELQKLRQSGVDLFIYINKEPSQFLRLLLSGINGHTFDDEFYFDDEEELSSLIDTINDDDSDGNFALSTTRASVETLTDFVQAFTRGESRINTPLYLETVNNAIAEIVKVNEVQETAITTMGSSALDVFAQVSTILTKMTENYKAVEKQLQQAEEHNSQSMNSRGLFSNSVDTFPTVSYSDVIQKMLLVREYSPCRYLTSFVLGYAHYLKYVLNKRVKLVFAIQKGGGVAKRYEGFATMLTTESVTNDALYDSPIIAINNPKKATLNSIFKRQGNKMDVVIVVDRLYSSTDIVSGSVVKVNAAGGYSDIERFKLDPKNTILPYGYSKDVCMMTIPMIRNYPRDEDARRANYNQAFANDNYYKVLDKKLGF